MSAWRKHFEDARKRHRWENKTAIAEAIGEDRNKLYRWLRKQGDKSEPKISTAIAIAELTGLSLDELFRGILPADDHFEARMIQLLREARALERTAVQAAAGEKDEQAQPQQSSG